jgi:hypothetical protein
MNKIDSQSILKAADSNVRQTDENSTLANQKIVLKTDLCLEHVPKTASDVTASTYTLCRVNVESITPPGEPLDLETFKEDTQAELVMPQSCKVYDSLTTIEFVVSPSDTSVCVDVSGLMNVTLSFPEQRFLKPMLNTDNEDNLIVFMIASLGSEQSSDRFYSSNSVDHSPQLVFSQISPDDPVPSMENETSSPFSPTFPPTNVASPQSSPSSKKSKSSLYGLLGLLLLIPPLFWFWRGRCKQGKNDDDDDNDDDNNKVGTRNDLSEEEGLIATTTTTAMTAAATATTTPLDVSASGEFVDTEAAASANLLKQEKDEDPQAEWEKDDDSNVNDDSDLVSVEDDDSDEELDSSEEDDDAEEGSEDFHDENDDDDDDDDDDDSHEDASASELV